MHEANRFEDDRSFRSAGAYLGERPANSRLFGLVAVALTIGMLHWGKQVLLPFALAVLFGFLLTPLVVKLERLRMGRIPSVILVVLFTGLVLGGIGWLVAGQMVELSAKLPDYRGNLVDRVRTLGVANGKFRRISEVIEDISREIAPPASRTDEHPSRPPDRNAKAGDHPAGDHPADDHPVPVAVVSMPPSPLNLIKDWLGPVVSPLLTAGLVAVLMVFVLVYREDVRNRLIQLLGTTHLRVTTEALTDATFRISRYLRTQLVINTCYGLCVGLGLFLIGVPNALLWGVLGLMLRFLPYAGPWLAASMPLMLSLAVFDDWRHPLLAAGLFILLELIVNNVLEPWLYGSSIGVSPLGIVLAAVFWTWVWGPVGLVLAVPLTVCLAVASRHLPQLQFVAILFSDRSTMALPDRLYQRLLAWDDDEAAVLAQSFLKQGTLDELFDVGLVPTLGLAEADRHAGFLDPSQEAFVMQSVRELADEFGEGVSPPPCHKPHPGTIGETSNEATGESEPRPAQSCILCIAVRDEADEIAARMLAQLLGRKGFQVDMGSTVVQASELLERTQLQHPDAIVLSMVPPLGSRDGRYLCRRVRAALPNLPILAGLWGGQDLDTAQERLISAGASQIVTSFREAVATLEALRRSHSLPGPG